jgi:hypothetical protein
VRAALVPQALASIVITVRLYIEVTLKLLIARLVLLRCLPSVRAGDRVVRHRDDPLGVVHLSALVLLPINIHTRLAHSYSAATQDQISLGALKEEGAARMVSRIASSLSATLDGVLWQRYSRMSL